MRTILLAGILVIGGCAGQPSTTAPANATATAPATATATAPATATATAPATAAATAPATAAATAPATAAAAGQPQQTASDDELDKKRLAEAIKHGYKVVNTNGEVLYCRSDLATASHIQRNTVCLTARQLDQLDMRNQRDLVMPNTPINMKNNAP
jgi:hypothetical protein